MRRTSLSRKLQSARGETLVEVLASIVIGALSIALLFGCVMASWEMDRGTARTDQDYYAGLSAAEMQGGTPIGNGSVKITGNSLDGTVNVSIYGGAGMYSYRLDPGGTPVPPEVEP